METLTYGQMVLEPGLKDWHYALGYLQAHFVTGKFAKGLELLNRVGALAEEQDHHPDVDLRYRHLVIRLTSHDAGGVTQRDLRLARAVSAAAAELGIASQPPEIAFEVGIDTADAAGIAGFWIAVLGYKAVGGTDGGPPDLVDPVGIRPTVWFQHMDPIRTQRNRLHFDVWVTPEVALQRVEAAVAAGGTLLRDEDAPTFWVLADPDGNEVCICTADGRSQ